MNQTKREKNDTGTELTKVKVNNPQPTSATTATTTCNPEVCRDARNRYQPPDLASDSPWNHKKTYFFLGTMCIFVLWIVIYSIVSEKKLV